MNKAYAKASTLNFDLTSASNVLIVVSGSVDISNAGNESGSAVLKVNSEAKADTHVANLGSSLVSLPFTVHWAGVLGAGSHTVDIEQDIAEGALNTPIISVIW